jgi:hypothetical protein
MPVILALGRLRPEDLKIRRKDLFWLTVSGFESCALGL